MAATFTLPNGETILIPQIKSISKICAFEMDINRGIIKKIEDHKQPKEVTDLVSLERNLDVLDADNLVKNYSYIGFDIILWDNDVKRVTADFYLTLKKLHEKENFSYEIAKTELRNIIRQVVTSKEDLVLAIEEFYKTHNPIHS
ncbi:MAG: hypothetical protein U9P79_06250 [Candidatus Cloacimonadota bacterium]|nr:hypothetical protein [Candidatus Cloacimonadota bacterium]